MTILRTTVAYTFPRMRGPMDLGWSSRNGCAKAASAAGIPCFGLWADAVVNAALSKTLGFPQLESWGDRDFHAVVAPLDILMGAPSGAIVVGRDTEIERVRSSLRDCGSELATAYRAAVVIALQLGASSETVDAGALQGLAANPEALQERSRRIAVQLDQNGLSRQPRSSKERVRLDLRPGTSTNSRVVRSSWNRMRIYERDSSRAGNRKLDALACWPHMKGRRRSLISDLLTRRTIIVSLKHSATEVAKTSSANAD